MSQFRIGMAVVPRSPAGAVRDAEFAEATGFDAVWLGDTLGDWLDPARPFLDPWPLFGTLAERTSRVTLGTLVTNVSWRTPVEVARWTVAVDQLCGGRFELGLGCGYVDDQRMAGRDVVDMTATERVSRLGEALVVLNRLLGGDASAFEGSYTAYEAAAIAPGPAGQRHLPLIVAGVGERVMRLAARWADRWNTFVDTPTIDEYLPIAGQRLARLDHACAQVGRDPASLGRGLTLYFEAVDVWTDADVLVRIIDQYLRAGFDEFVVYPPTPDRFGDVARAMGRLSRLR